MKLLFSTFLGVILLLLGQAVFAAPDGGITISNMSNDSVTAQVSTFGKFTLAANQTKSVPYNSLSRACSDNPSNCRAQFYVNNVPAGSAIINVETGKLVGMNLSMKVRTIKGENNILRSVIIK